MLVGPEDKAAAGATDLDGSGLKTNDTSTRATSAKYFEHVVKF